MKAPPGFIKSAALQAVRATTSLTRQSVCTRRARTSAFRMSSSDSASPSVQEPSMVRARHILVETEEMIDAIQKQVEKGEKSFAELATMVSTCTSKDKGGDLGWFRRDIMVKEFENAAFTNPPGSLVKVKSEFGWHLIKVEGHGTAAKMISVKEFAERFGKDGSDNVANVQLIDCREKEELEKAALPNFMNLPMGEYAEWADAFDNGELGLEKEKETIVMCHHGVRSANFCSFLAQQGFTRVRNMTGGIDAYSKKVDPSVPLY